MIRRLETRRRQQTGQDGFTLIELMIALTILLIGVSGILSLQLVTFQSTAYSRHATEAAILAEDKMEQLRTMPSTMLANDTELDVNSQGIPNSGGIYTRSWTSIWTGTRGHIEVVVSWDEEGSEAHSVTYRTERLQ